MKNILKKVLVLLMFTTACLFVAAQTAMDSIIVVGNDTILNPNFSGAAQVSVDTFKGYAQSLAGLGFAVMIIVAFVRGKGTKNGGIPRWAIQVVSWIVGPVLALVFMALGWGMFAAIPWTQVLIGGFLASLIANGVASSFVVQAIYDSIYSKK